MSETATKPIPTWFWFAAGGALIWNLIGALSYIASVTMSVETVAQLTEAERQLRDATPAFVTGAYAVAVFAGTFGAAFLLLRKSWAVHAFSISLIALLVQFGYLFLAMNIIATAGGATTIFPAFIILIGLLLLRFSLSAQRNGWLK